jgi:hypothetical protein
MQKVTKFILNSSQITSIREKDVPSDLITDLDGMIGTKYSDITELINKLKSKIGADIVEQYYDTLVEVFDPVGATFSESSGNIVTPNDIVTFNESRSCHDLVRMYSQGQLNIQPEFQREIVWENSAQSRFIDSLIKQLPIPSLCFSLDYKTQKRLVIDGLQRMQTIINFLESGFWKVSNIEDIDPRIRGCSVSDIRKTNPELISLVENITLPITVIRCDYSKETHNNFLFTVFHRLNSGGKTLNNQEIRNCIFTGSFNKLLKECNQNSVWRNILGLNKNYGYRFKYEEIILRFFAFKESWQDYDGKLAKFLNTFMFIHKEVSQETIKKYHKSFDRTIDILSKIFDHKPTKISISVLEAMMVGIGSNIERLESMNATDLKYRYNLLLNGEPFTNENLMEGLSRKEKVLNRIEFSINKFS